MFAGCRCLRVGRLELWIDEEVRMRLAWWVRWEILQGGVRVLGGSGDLARLMFLPENPLLQPRLYHLGNESTIAAST